VMQAQNQSLAKKWAATSKRLRSTGLDQSISLKFLLETRLETESFEPLVDFLKQGCGTYLLSRAA